MRKVNVQGMEIGVMGMGCMGFSHAHGDPAPREECISMMRKAHEMGVTLYDTADVYANGHNEILVGEALAPIRSEVQILTKFNPEVAPVNDPANGTVAQQIEARCDASLKRLGTDNGVKLFIGNKRSFTNINCKSLLNILTIPIPLDDLAIRLSS